MTFRALALCQSDEKPQLTTSLLYNCLNQGLCELTHSYERRDEIELLCVICRLCVSRGLLKSKFRFLLLKA